MNRFIEDNLDFISLEVTKSLDQPRDENGRWTDGYDVMDDGLELLPDSDATPEEARDAWNATFPGHTKMTLEEKLGMRITGVEVTGGSSMYLQGKLVRDGMTLGRVELTFTKGQYSELGLISLNAGYTGGGVGKEFMREYVELVEETGGKGIDLLADIDVGGYAWARMGFEAQGDGWKEAVEERVKDMYLKSELVNDVKETLEKGDINDIASLSDPVHTEDGVRKLGAALLMGSTWEGRLDFKNEVAMKTFRSYIGKHSGK